MSSSIFIHGEFDPIRIVCGKGEDTIWIRTPNETVALSLGAKDLDALESAIATARLSLREVAA